MFNPSLADATNLPDFDPKVLENFDDIFGENGGFSNSVLEGFATAAAPTFEDVDFSRQPQEIIPMQQQPIDPSPATLAPPQGIPAMPAGMAYHPAVGYYWPVDNAQMPGFPGAPGQFGMAPAFPAPPAPMMGQPSVTQVPNVLENLFNAGQAETTTKKSRAKRIPSGTKRKYGPAAYLEEQAKRRAIGDDSGPRPISRDLNYPAPANWAKQQKKQNAAQTSGAMHDLNVATVMRCRCEIARKATERHIPRPRNAFMIFRNDFSAKWRTSKSQKRGTANASISIAAGEAWKALKDRGKAGSYFERAFNEKEEHMRQYPDYSYTPIKKIQAKFGQPNCTCGAYKTNMAEMKRLKEGGATPPNRFRVLGETDDEGDAYVAPRTRSVSRANSLQTPAAQVMPPDFGADMPDFGFSLDTQNADASLDWAAFEAFNNATENVESEEPPTKRRSSRNSKKSVHYADDANEDEGEDEEPAASTFRKHRPSPISTSRKSSANSPLNSADFKLDETTSVASRTRSKSLSASASEDDQALPTGVSSPSSLFDESEDGDNIVVATPMSAKSKPVALALPPRQTRSKSQSRGRGRRRS